MGNSTPSIRVLIADDESAVRAILDHHLRSKGYDTTCVNDGQGLLDELDRGEFDAVILDIGLPGKGGLEVLREVRMRWPAKPVVVITGLDDEAVENAAREFGASEYLIKPVSLAILEEALVRSIRSGG